MLEDESKAKMPLKEAMRTTGAKRIREACLVFVKELKESINLGTDAQHAKKKAPQERFNASYVVAGGEKAKTSQLKIKYSFVPPPPVIYETLLDTDRIRGATASDASMSKEVGGKFSMFSGSVEGENVTLTPFDGTKATIVWKWRFATWQPNHFGRSRSSSNRTRTARPTSSSSRSACPRRRSSVPRRGEGPAARPAQGDARWHGARVSHTIRARPIRGSRVRCVNRQIY